MTVDETDRYFTWPTWEPTALRSRYRLISDYTDAAGTVWYWGIATHPGATPTSHTAKRSELEPTGLPDKPPARRTADLPEGTET